MFHFKVYMRNYLTVRVQSCAEVQSQRADYTKGDSLTLWIQCWQALVNKTKHGQHCDE